MQKLLSQLGLAVGADPELAREPRHGVLEPALDLVGLHVEQVGDLLRRHPASSRQLDERPALWIQARGRRDDPVGAQHGAQGTGRLGR